VSLLVGSFYTRPAVCAVNQRNCSYNLIDSSIENGVLNLNLASGGNTSFNFILPDHEETAIFYNRNVSYDVGLGANNYSFTIQDSQVGISTLYAPASYYKKYLVPLKISQTDSSKYVYDNNFITIGSPTTTGTYRNTCGVDSYFVYRYSITSDIIGGSTFYDFDNIIVVDGTCN
jgi:hypothetical protein